MVTGKNKFNTFRVGHTKKEELHSTSTLLIESEVDQLSYAIIDKGESSCVGLCSIPIDVSNGRMERRSLLKELFQNDEILNFPFSKRAILMANRECVFIPEEVFDPEKLDFYIHSSFGENFVGKCFSNKIPELKNHLVFKVPDWLVSLYNETMSGVSLSHASAFLVESIFRLSKQQSKAIIHAHFKRSFFEFVIFKEGKMLFYNSFSYQTSEDIAYFIMYALKQWDIEENEISISGILNAESEELFWLRKYLGTMKNFPLDQLLPFPPALESPAAFINLLNPSHCE